MDVEEKLMSNDDLLEKRLHQILEELGKLSYGDPKRKDLIFEAKAISEVIKFRSDSEQAEISNRLKEELDRAKIEVDATRNKIEKKRIGVIVFQSIAYMVTGGVITGISYVGDEIFQKSRTLQKFADDVRKFFETKIISKF